MPTPTGLRPPPIALHGLNVLTLGTSTALPCGISNDRKTVYGAVASGGGTALYQSTDSAATWTSVHTFPEFVRGLLETDDGEAICITSNASSTPGYVYKSSGWSTSHTTATWTKTLSGIGGYFRPWWSGGHFCAFGNDQAVAGTSRYGVINEYGVQTSASGDQTLKATRAWFTADYGATWTLVLDLNLRYPGIAPLHLHATAYDPYWDRLWATYGDTNSEPTVNGVVKQGLLYSDDHGATWQSVPLATEWGTDYLQSTALAVFEDHILIASDNGPGMLRLARKGYRSIGPVQVVSVMTGGTGAQMLAMGVHRNRNQPGAPLFLCVNGVTSTGGARGSLQMSLDNLTYLELWRDEAWNSNKGPNVAFGPTSDGIVVGDISGATLFRGEIVYVETGMLDGYATFTGDGTTTAFNIPHGLPVTPSRFQAWSSNAVGGPFTVTANATTLTVTFATAPINATTPVVAWRAGA